MGSVDKILALMEEKRVSAAQLTREAGITRGLVTQWKQRLQKPSMGNITKLAAYFDVTVDYIIGIEKDRPHEGERSVDPTIAGIIEAVQDMTEDEVAKVQEYAQLLKLKRTQPP